MTARGSKIRDPRWPGFTRPYLPAKTGEVADVSGPLAKATKSRQRRVRWAAAPGADSLVRVENL